MTYLEYIQHTVGVNWIEEDRIYEVALIGEGLDPDDNYVAGKSVDMAIVAVIRNMLSGIKRVSEGGYTVELDTKALEKMLSYYLGKWGLKDYTKPIITGRATYLW